MNVWGRCCILSCNGPGKEDDCKSTGDKNSFSVSVFLVKLETLCLKGLYLLYFTMSYISPGY